MQMDKDKIIEEINKAEQHLAKLRKELEKPDGKVWKPRLGEKYYSLKNDGAWYSLSWGNSIGDKERWKYGNVYKSTKRAELAANKRLIRVQLERYALEHNEIFKDKDTSSIRILRESNEIVVVSGGLWWSDEVLFSSRNIAYDAINEIGEYNLKLLLRNN